MKFLVLRLYGPMASWGDIAVGETRPSYSHPSKSAVLGLVAAAMGIKREEEEVLRKLNSGYGFAVRVDSSGIPLSDYHTAQVPPSGTGRNRMTFYTRKNELTTLPKDDLNTILSQRDYRVESLYTAVLWPKTAAPYDLETIAGKLNEPVYTLYLGRKSCPLALPVEAQVIEAETLYEALQKSVFVPFNELPRGAAALYWEEIPAAGIEPHHTFERRDASISRSRWQFDLRKEYHASLSEGG